MKRMKTIKYKGFLPIPRTMGRSVAVKTPGCFQNANITNISVYTSYGKALKKHFGNLLFNRKVAAGLLFGLLCVVGHAAECYDTLKTEFLSLPMAKRLSMPLFWLHGEDDPTLKDHVDRVIHGGNGGLVIESRTHPDWLGSEWLADCKVIADYAKTSGLKCWIFDEKWWPSFGGRSIFR